VPFWSLMIFFTQEGVEIFEFRQKHSAGELNIFIQVEFHCRATTGTGSIHGGLGVHVQGVWGGHLARV